MLRRYYTPECDISLEQVNTRLYRVKYTVTGASLPLNMSTLEMKERKKFTGKEFDGEGGRVAGTERKVRK
jgi:hypothetical protein